MLFVASSSPQYQQFGCKDTKRRQLLVSRTKERGSKGIGQAPTWGFRFGRSKRGVTGVSSGADGHPMRARGPASQWVSVAHRRARRAAALRNQRLPACEQTARQKWQMGGGTRVFVQRRVGRQGRGEANSKRRSGGDVEGFNAPPIITTCAGRAATPRRPPRRRRRRRPRAPRAPRRPPRASRRPWSRCRRAALARGGQSSRCGRP